MPPGVAAERRRGGSGGGGGAAPTAGFPTAAPVWGEVVGGGITLCCPCWGKTPAARRNGSGHVPAASLGVPPCVCTFRVRRGRVTPPIKIQKSVSGFGPWRPGMVDLRSSKMGGTLGFHRELLGWPGRRVITIFHVVYGFFYYCQASCGSLFFFYYPQAVLPLIA